jgi:hypothetical protein
MRLDHPAIALLNPPYLPDLPVGFTLHKLQLDQAIPARLPLSIPGSSGALTLVIASARATAWKAIPTDTVIASAAAQRSYAAVPTPPVDCFAAARAPTAPYLVLTEDSQIVDICPLVTGLRHILARGPLDRRRAIAEIVILDFQITASALSGGRPVACRIDMALRELTAAPEFRAPMISRPLLQTDLFRNPDVLPLDTNFASAVERDAMVDGTPVGGIDRAIVHGRR